MMSLTEQGVHRAINGIGFVIYGDDREYQIINVIKHLLEGEEVNSFHIDLDRVQLYDNSLGSVNLTNIPDEYTRNKHVILPDLT